MKIDILRKRNGQEQEHSGIIRRLVETRDHLGITQKEFADMMGVSVSTIKQIENGYQAPTLTFIIKWNKYCKKSLNWIFYGVD